MSIPEWRTLIIDQSLRFDWKLSEALWTRAVNVAWTQEVVQDAAATATDEDVEAAVVQVLGPRGAWTMVSALGLDGKAGLQRVPDIEGRISLFLDQDIARRCFPDEGEFQLHDVFNEKLKVLVKYAVERDDGLALIHHFEPPHRYSFVDIDKDRLKRIATVLKW